MKELLDPPKQVLIGPQALEGELVLPPRAQAIIVFAHGSGSGRRSPRNLQVAHALNEQRLGTLLFDLLRPEEALDRDNVFDIELLGRRVTDAIEWLDRRPSLAALPLGLFGASTGAAAALVAAAARPERVFAVVSRGGRPDLAGNALPRVSAPTLLIVGGADTEVLGLNRRLFAQTAHVASGQWGGAPGGMPARLSLQSMGVLGLGRIGREVARKAQGVGLKVLAHDPYLQPDQAQALGVELVGLDELLRRADYLSIHCPLTKETRHLIGAAQLALMKPTAFLINMARGPVVDQPALCQALVSGDIAGAAADVLEQEPPDPNDPLLKLPNMFVTPHFSSASTESVVQLRRDVARHVVQVLRGEPPQAVVNPQYLRGAAGSNG